MSVFELKNPADETVSISDAYDQTHIRYSQDIPSLMKFDFINVINKIKALRPEWFVKRKCAPEYEGTAIDRDSIEIEKVMLVCTNGKNDPAEMTAVIGDSKTRKA